MQDKLQKMPYTQHSFAISVSDLRTLFCCKNYLCTFLSQKEFVHTFFVANTVYVFFRENDLRTSSGKFLRVESCHPESLDFLGLCWWLFRRNVFNVDRGVTSLPREATSFKNRHFLRTASFKIRHFL